MTVDIVVDHFSDLQWDGTGPNNVPNIGAGALAWCSLDDILAIQTELGGDWLPYLQAGALYNAPPVAAPVGLAAGAASNVTVTFPSGKFTQAPRIVGVTGNNTRYNYAVLSVDKDHAVIRVQNVTTSASTDTSPYVQLTAIQSFV